MLAEFKRIIDRDRRPSEIERYRNARGVLESFLSGGEVGSVKMFYRDVEIMLGDEAFTLRVLSRHSPSTFPLDSQYIRVALIAKKDGSSVSSTFPDVNNFIHECDDREAIMENVDLMEQDVIPLLKENARIKVVESVN